MKIAIYITLALIFTLFCAGILIAQPSMPLNPSQAPIDGGLSVLAAAGGAYAIKKLRDRKKEAEAMDDLDV